MSSNRHNREIGVGDSEWSRRRYSQGQMPRIVADPYPYLQAVDLRVVRCQRRENCGYLLTVKFDRLAL